MSADEIIRLLQTLVWPVTLIILLLVFRSRVARIMAALERFIDRLKSVELEALGGKLKALSAQAQEVQRVLDATEPVDPALTSDAETLNRPELRAGSQVEAVQRYYDLVSRRIRSQFESRDTTTDLEQMSLEELAGILAYQGKIDSTLHDGIAVLNSMYQTLLTDPRLIDDESHFQSFASLAQSIAARLVVPSE
jgi:hypothetical protein